LLLEETRGILRELEKDYRVAYELAYHPLRGAGHDRISGGAVPDPTLATAAGQQRLKAHLRHVGTRVQREHEHALELFTNLHKMLDASDDGRAMADDRVEYPRTISRDEMRALHLARERRERVVG
jgi:hypothetical protein